jgi:hypothetical protein
MLYYWSFSCDEAARYRRAAALLYLSFISVLVVVLKELALAIRDAENAAFEGAILAAQKVQARRGAPVLAKVAARIAEREALRLLESTSGPRAIARYRMPSYVAPVARRWPVSGPKV